MPPRDEAVPALTAALLRALERAPVDASGTVALLDDTGRLPQVTALGRYEQVGVLADGSLGQVRLARDTVLRRLVALKVMRDELADRPGPRRRFLTEAHLAAQLDHPNILPVYEVLDHEPPAYAMKWVDGVTLQAHLDASVKARLGGGEVPAHLRRAALVDIVRKLCDALAYAHARGVVHRDLKPEHVMLGAHGEVYVMDWSLAHVRDAEDLLGRLGDATLPGEVVGTPHYVAPEQAGGGEVGPAADQYALGLILYEAIAGHRARPDVPLPKLVSYAASGTLRPLRAIERGAVPAALQAIVARALHPDPARRYPSVATLGEDLRRYRLDEPVVALREGVVARLGRAVARRREAALTASVALALLVGTSGAVVAVAFAGAGVGLQWRVQAREASWRQLVTEVGDRAAGLDRAMGVVASQLVGLDRAAERLLVDALPEPGDVIRVPEDFARADRKPPDTAWSARYARVMSTRWPAAVAAPDTSIEEVEATLRRLMPLRHAMRRAHLVSRQILDGLTEAEAERSWRDEEGPLRWTFVGTADGAYLDLPGAQWDASGYDPRRRPWYTLGRDADGATWGGPYPESSTGELLVPCVSRLSAPDGGLLGVVAMDVAFSYLIKRHLRFDHPAATESFLVDGQGRVMVRSSEVGPEGRPTSLEATWSTPAFEHPELASALGAQAGVVDVDGGATRLVHVPLSATDWWYVVAFDAARLE